MSFLDFHNHLLPGVDDGAQTIDESCAALTALQSDKVSAVISTPHVDGSLTLDPAGLEERLRALDRAWALLRTHAASHHAAVSLHRGVELMIDTPEPQLTDDRLRLAGSSYILVEFPYMTVPPRSAEALAYIKAHGFTPILAHPERYVGFDPALQLATQWRNTGAALQINGPSLLGRYGREARSYALRMLEAGLCSFLSSDYHARGKPLVLDYHQVLVEMGAAEQAEMLMQVNPRRILSSEPPLPVPPFRMKKRTLWSQIGALFRSS